MRIVDVSVEMNCAFKLPVEIRYRVMEHDVTDVVFFEFKIVVNTSEQLSVEILVVQKSFVVIPNNKDFLAVELLEDFVCLFPPYQLKSPRIYTVSFLETVSFQRAINVLSISSTSWNGLLSNLMTFSCPK